MSRHLAIGIASLALSATATRTASAHHEAWVLRESGTQCSFIQPEGDWRDYYRDGLFNWAPYRRWMSCPLSLSARWGSSNTGTIPTYWAMASTAAAYVYNAAPGEEFYCAVQAQMASGAILYSQTVTSTATGDLRLMPNWNSDWSGSLGPAKLQELYSLEFVCLVPPNGSGVYGYKTRMCIRNECVADAFGEGAYGEANTRQQGLWDEVQTSGIACLANNNDNLVRSELGAKNVGTGYVSVVCPISPPADDTNEVPQRLIQHAVAWYKSSPGGTEVPICQLHSSMRAYGDPLNTLTEAVVSSPFTPVGDKSVELYNFSVGTAPDGSSKVDIALTINCELPPGYTLQGVTARIGIPPVSGGQ